jgi:hypothetical protein
MLATIPSDVEVSPYQRVAHRDRQEEILATMMRWMRGARSLTMETFGCPKKVPDLLARLHSVVLSGVGMDRFGSRAEWWILHEQW